MIKKIISRSTILLSRSFKNYTFEASQLKNYMKYYDITTGSKIRNQTMSTLSDIPSVNEDDNNIKKNNINNKSASIARNENSHDYILGSELSPKDKKNSDIDTEIVGMKAKITKLEVKREEVKIAIKQIERDMSKCTSKTDQQELSAKLSTEKTIYNSLTQEIVADITRINFLASQMNGINLPSSADRGK